MEAPRRAENLKEDRDRGAALWRTGSFSSAKVRMNFTDNNGLFFCLAHARRI